MEEEMIGGKGKDRKGADEGGEIKDDKVEEEMI